MNEGCLLTISSSHICLAEGITRREELRRQKWNIKSLELQLDAASSLANPRFDFVSTAQVNQFGDHLLGNTNTPFNNAYATTGQFNQTGYQLGFEFSVPLGLRNALSQVRNYELRLMKARDVLAQQELEVSHELANSFQQLSWRYTTAQTNFNRRRAAERQLQAFDAEYRAGTKTLDLLLQAQSRLAAAEIAYFQSITAYNRAINDLHYRKGTLLEHNSVHLAEGMWNPDAYKDALRKAWARTYAFDALEQDPLRTEPTPFVGMDVESEGAVYGDDFQEGSIPEGEAHGDGLHGTGLHGHEGDGEGLNKSPHDDEELTPENTPSPRSPYTEDSAMGLTDKKLGSNPAVEKGPSMPLPEGPVADRSGRTRRGIGNTLGAVPTPIDTPPE